MEVHVSNMFKLAAVFSLTHLFAISKEYKRRDAIDEVFVTHCLQRNEVIVLLYFNKHGSYCTAGKFGS